MVRRSMQVMAVVVGLTLALVGCASGGGGDPQRATRTVTDSTGAQVQVPDNPQRVVSLHYAGTQTMIDLGRFPVGQAEVDENLVPEQLAAQVESIPVVASRSEINVEAVANLKPDLILAHEQVDPGVVDQLDKIAPVYKFSLRPRGGWQVRVDLFGELFNEQGKAAQLRADLSGRQQQLKTDYADVIDGKTVATIDTYRADTAYVNGAANMSGQLLVPVGFTWSPDEEAAAAQFGEDPPEGEISTEQLPSSFGDADVIFYGTDLRAKPTAGTSDLLASKGYQGLPAVRTKNSYPFGKLTIAGYQDANYALDRVEDALKSMGKNKKK